MEIIELEYGGLSLPDLLKKLNDSDILLNKYAIILLSEEFFQTSETIKKIYLKSISVKELGFPEGATLKHIENVLNKHGLSECPLEIAPYLRLYLTAQPEINLETKNQAPPESLTIFSKIPDDDNFPKGFYLRKNNGKLCLRGYTCSYDYLWNPEDKMVFCLKS